MWHSLIGIKKLIKYTSCNGQSFHGLRSTHAEVALAQYLIRRGLHKFPIDILVIRWDNGNFGISKPCGHCIDFMRKNIRVRHVYYSVSDGSIAHESINNMSNKLSRVEARRRHQK